MYIFGASGHGKVVLEIAEENNIEVKGFIDNNNTIKNILGYSVLHLLPKDGLKLHISIGNNRVRKTIAEQYNFLKFNSLIHPNAYVSKRSKIGEGCAVMSGVSINTEVIIGNHCIINTNASVDHECIIHDYVHLSPNVGLAGNVEVGEGTHIGIGSSVIQGIKIGKWCTIGAGAVIINDVPDYAVVVGNPGKIIKYKEF